MSSKVQSYLCTLIVGLALLICYGEANAQEIFLDPDQVFITTGAGTQFDLELRVDEHTQGIRLFQVLIAFDTSKADTLSTALGPLFDATTYTKVFNSYIYYDTDYGTSILRLEGLLFGATAVVDGPGVVAEVSFITKGTGELNMQILEHVMTDINNDPIASTAAGAVIYINNPPAEFNLLEPFEDEQVPIFPDSNLHLVWQSSSSAYPGESVEYTCELSKSPGFLPGMTTTFASLTDTTVDVDGSSLTLDQTYWFRVTAEGTVNGYQRESTPFGRSFFVVEPEAPSAFALLEPAAADSVIVGPGGSVQFVWEAATSPYPEAMLYDISVSSSPSFPPAGTYTEPALTDTTVSISSNDLTEGPLYWRVTAYGATYGLSVKGSPDPQLFYLAIGAAPGDFELLSPLDGGLTDIYGRASILFDWSDAPSVLPNDTTWYILAVAADPGFSSPSLLLVDSVMDVSEMDVPTAILPVPEFVYWKVLARNRAELTKESTSQYSTRCFMRGDMIAPWGDLDPVDLSFLVEFLFAGGALPLVEESGDLECGGDIDPVDLSFFVEFFFAGGPGPYCP